MSYGCGRPEKPLAVTKGQAEVPQVGIGEIVDDIEIDAIFQESLAIPLKPNAGEPVSDIGHDLESN
ncbi:hypothetical protein EFR01_44850 [Sinorhizobium fredii]|nr:hypothetical protein EFR01_44850 [Sinorhizobium fredii]GLS06789.1 hypothetical protein GCM10007864_04140 [Sinorhizobium fredii]